MRMSPSGGHSGKTPQSPRDLPGKMNKDPGGKTAGVLLLRSRI